MSLTSPAPHATSQSTAGSSDLTAFQDIEPNQQKSIPLAGLNASWFSASTRALSVSVRASPLRRLWSADGLALLISLIGVFAAYLVADRVYERMPHIEDEVAYVWQARVIAHGGLTVAAPAHPTSFLVPFVVEANGQRSGKYPLGWPALLSLGIRLGLRAWINPLLAGLGVWLTYCLGKRFFSVAVGLLAAGLTVASPFFLLNSGSLLSHPFGLVLSAAFALAWLDLFFPRHSEPAQPAGNDPQSSIRNPQSAGFDYGPQSEPAQPAGNNLQSKIRNLKSTLLPLAAGLSLGMLVLTRPYTAVAIAIPFGLHGLYLLVRGDWAVRRRVLAIGLIALALSGLYFVWQYAVTGDPLKNPYLLWWPYDQIGFGKGHGVLPQGHNLPQAWYNTRQSLASGFRDLFGWGVRLPLDASGEPFAPGYSWIFLPFGLLAITIGNRRPSWKIWKTLNGPAWLLVLAMLSLIVLYMAYWIGSELYGPRYYYEGLFAVTLLSAAGIAWLAGWPVNPPRAEAESQSPARKEHAAAKGKQSKPQPTAWDRLARLRPGIVALIVAGLVIYNLVAYLPGRLQEMHGLYGVSRQNINQFLAAKVEGQGTAPILPALVIVHSGTWHFYGALLELENPYLTTPYIFAWSIQSTVDFTLHNDFPGRTVYHYYQDDPTVLYQRPR